MPSTLTKHSATGFLPSDIKRIAGRPIPCAFRWRKAWDKQMPEAHSPGSWPVRLPDISPRALGQRTVGIHGQREVVLVHCEFAPLHHVVHLAGIEPRLLPQLRTRILGLGGRLVIQRGLIVF